MNGYVKRNQSSEKMNFYCKCLHPSLSSKNFHPLHRQTQDKNTTKVLRKLTQHEADTSFPFHKPGLSSLLFYIPNFLLSPSFPFLYEKKRHVLLQKILSPLPQSLFI